MKKLFVITLVLLIIPPLLISCKGEWTLVDEGVLSNFTKTSGEASFIIDGHLYHIDTYLSYENPVCIGEYYYLYRDISLAGYVYKLSKTRVVSHNH